MDNNRKSYWAANAKLIIDALEGRIDRLMPWGVLKKSVGSRTSQGYLVVRVDRIQLKSHRIIYSHFHGPIAPWMEFDHINGVRSDNRIGNLRRVTHEQNMQNRQDVHRNNASGFRGVHFEKATGRWKAQISINGKQTNIGRFEFKEDAVAAYAMAAAKFHTHNPSAFVGAEPQEAA